MARPALIKTGLGIIVITILVGRMPTSILMVDVFHQAASNEGAIDAGELLNNIGISMIWTAALKPVAGQGVCLLIAGLAMAPKKNYGVPNKTQKGTQIPCAPEGKG